MDQEDGESLPEAPPATGRIDGKLGCAIVFAIGLASMFGAFYIMRRKAATQLDAAAELAELVKAAEQAEGTGALRGLGCSRAAILPMESVGSVAQRLENARAEKEKREPKMVDVGTDRAAVVCAASGASAVPTCKDVAVAFAGAVKNAALPFVVVVEVGEKPSCTEEYGGDPEKMKPASTLDLPPIFPASE
jgi:hypothetical protein